MKYNVRLESKAVDGRPVCRYEFLEARGIREAWMLADHLAYRLNHEGGQYVVGAVGHKSVTLPEAPCSQ